MPLRFLTLRRKGYNTIPTSQSPNLASAAAAPASPEIRADSGGHYDPAPAKSSGDTARSPGSSTVCLPGTPRHGPLIDFDDGGDDDDDYDGEMDSETERIVAEVRREMTAEEFGATVEEIYGFRNEEGAAPDGIAAGRGLRPSLLLRPPLHNGAYVCDDDEGREDLRKYFGVDEDAFELEGELTGDEQVGTVIETLFDSSSEGGGCESYCSSAASDDSWCTTNDIAASRIEDAPISNTGGDAAGKGMFVPKWLGLGKKTRPAEEKGKTVPPTDFDAELLGLVNEETAEWTKIDKEVSDTGSDAVSNDAESSFQKLRYEVLGNVDMEEVDSLFAQMETAEEGQSTEVGPLQTVRHYGEDTSDSVEYVVVDRPSLDFLDRLGALEGANLRKGRK